MNEIPQVLLCEVNNELEASMVVNLLQEEEILASSDAPAAMTTFGGLGFEPGHKIFVPAPQARKAIEILERYPHFKNLKNVHIPE